MKRTEPTLTDELARAIDRHLKRHPRLRVSAILKSLAEVQRGLSRVGL